MRESSTSADSAARGRDAAIGRRVVGATRFIAILPTLGLLVCSITIVVVAAIKTVVMVTTAIGERPGYKALLVESVEIADTFLLGIVLYIISLGIFSLFVDDSVRLPKWLEFHDLEDLKEKLIGVVVVVLTVFFLGRVIEAKPEQYLGIAYLGIAMAAVIFAVGYYVKAAFKRG